MITGFLVERNGHASFQPEKNDNGFSGREECPSGFQPEKNDNGISSGNCNTGGKTGRCDDLEYEQR